jgi:hypothetical protein
MRLTGRMMKFLWHKLEVGLLREPIIGFGTEPSQKASVPVIGKNGLLVFAENSISIKK